jgi:hypothetical protein
MTFKNSCVCAFTGIFPILALMIPAAAHAAYPVPPLAKPFQRLDLESETAGGMKNFFDARSAAIESVSAVRAGWFGFWLGRSPLQC